MKNLRRMFYSDCRFGIGIQSISFRGSFKVELKTLAFDMKKFLLAEILEASIIENRIKRFSSMIRILPLWNRPPIQDSFFENGGSSREDLHSTEILFRYLHYSRIRNHLPDNPIDKMHKFRLRRSDRLLRRKRLSIAVSAIDPQMTDIWRQTRMELPAALSKRNR